MSMDVFLENDFLLVPLAHLEGVAQAIVVLLVHYVDQPDQILFAEPKIFRYWLNRFMLMYVVELPNFDQPKQ